MISEIYWVFQLDQGIVSYIDGDKTAAKSQQDQMLFMCPRYEQSLSAEKLMFLKHWPVMTFRHSAIPACLLSRQQTTSSHQDSQQCWGAFTNGCVPYHLENYLLQGPGDLQRVPCWWLPGLLQEKHTAVQCAILSSRRESEGGKPLYFTNSQFFMPCGHAEISAKWETIHLVSSFNSITDAEEC